MLDRWAQITKAVSASVKPCSTAPPSWGTTNTATDTATAASMDPSETMRVTQTVTPHTRRAASTARGATAM
jgi:hypothetical protein